jgi:hypothetical protein
MHEEIFLSPYSLNDLAILSWAGHGDRMNVLLGGGGLEGLIRSLFSPARKSISVILIEMSVPGRVVDSWRQPDS